MTVVAMGTGKFINPVLARSRLEAQRDGSATVEAPHLLLALAASDDATVRRALTAVGLDHTAIRDALYREFEHSLSLVGVAELARGLPRPSATPDPASALGASAKLAIARGVEAAADPRDFRPAHLLQGIVRAQAGTATRALDLIGVDRAELDAQVSAALGEA
ncbi:ATP-dependent Clp protease ATP-binding subunit ClpA [Nocardia sp. GP40]|uniref:Clp protease N-terminal domain-containing protein n=2 Tax=unclassified Nocardia TaxID=2637762 RepID=UPI003D1D9F5C